MYNSSRLYHTVRVRFAPSPTGLLHLGGLRTAVYNYLFAKKHNGKFILRIEDTDRTRLISSATSSIIDDLNWSGIVIDEGPSFGGKYGPYIQSQRIQIYTEAVDKLLATEIGYRCFCSENRLNLLRKRAAKLRQVPKYDNKCRHLSRTEIEEKLNKSAPYCIRLNMGNYSEPVHDLILGDIDINTAENEGDPVIFKSDGFPTYHFANVVDDHMMEISHVFRGVEWQMSTPKHLLLYKTLGWKPPKFGHLPLLINADGTKLSKRQGDISIKQFRDRGIFPLALVNYVMSAGGGIPKSLHATPKIETFEKLSQNFNIEKVNTSPGRLNPSLLDEFNKMEIMRRLSNKDESDKLISTVRDILYNKYPEKNANDFEDSYIRNILKWSARRLTTLFDLTSDKHNFLWCNGTVVSTDLTKDEVQKLVDCLTKSDFNKSNLQQVLKQYSTEISIKFPILMKTLRAVLSGSEEGPSVADILEILGKEIALNRIQSNLKYK